MCTKNCPTLSGQSLCRKRCYWEALEQPMTLDTPSKRSLEGTDRPATATERPMAPRKRRSSGEPDRRPPAGTITDFLKQGLTPTDVARILGTEVDYVRDIAESRNVLTSRPRATIPPAELAPPSLRSSAPGKFGRMTQHAGARFGRLFHVVGPR